mmetsp:Transcript_32970/g.52824  ORF Transcript_32970/g.52824 Transcript_32970/m.52824 type:complete len:82 (-) Transcript_32970:232-477(-)
MAQLKLVMLGDKASSDQKSLRSCVGTSCSACTTSQHRLAHACTVHIIAQLCNLHIHAYTVCGLIVATIGTQIPSNSTNSHT